MHLLHNLVHFVAVLCYTAVMPVVFPLMILPFSL